VVQSKASTPEEYLAELPEDRRQVVEAVRRVILDNLPEGYEESMTWGMPSYEIPLARYPSTYNKQPLAYAALAAQKNHFSLYLMSVYSDSDGESSLREQFAAAGKKLDMGKSCVRFRKLDDLPLDVIARVIAATPAEVHIQRYEASRKRK
jgi:uncharacterized protein YdhG (YjbR/CyaY superfamily)